MYMLHLTSAPKPKCPIKLYQFLYSSWPVHGKSPICSFLGTITSNCSSVSFSVQTTFILTCVDLM